MKKSVDYTILHLYIDSRGVRRFSKLLKHLNMKNRSNKPIKTILIAMLSIIFLAVVITTVSFLNIKEGIFPNSEIIPTVQIETKNPLDPMVIKEIEFIFNEGNDKIFINRNSDGIWVLKDQPEKNLSQDDVAYIFTLYNNLSVISSTSGPNDLSQLGLDPPTARLLITLKDGSLTELEIGKVDQQSGLYFVRENSGSPYLADYQTIYRLLKTFYLKVLPVVLSE